MYEFNPRVGDACVKTIAVVTGLLAFTTIAFDTLPLPLLFVGLVVSLVMVVNAFGEVRQ